MSADIQPTRARCFDDACRPRHGCLLWQARHDPTPADQPTPLAITWRKGWEWPDEICQKGRQAQPTPLTPA
jgi:hypothetical protein